MAGFTFFGWEVLKTRAVSRPSAWLTILGAIFFKLGLSGMFPMIVVKIGALLFGGGLILLGVDLWRGLAPYVPAKGQTVVPLDWHVMRVSNRTRCL
ncbi:hypothetical protein [Roseovarius sp. THAF9]|uniref:hypothetical protein n=1 Tax=Roseovarius sp. THAF9 TaxID=2587847 RepID=UPI001268E6F4|nr:hypothetical protein [Roseovarius sp. THAF9]